MKKIIKIALPNNYASFSDIQKVYNVPKDQLITMLSVHPEIFTICEDGIKYYPPYDITDKKKLQSAINRAFPKGIRLSALQLCYEFAESDCNQLIYQNSAITVPFGKTNEKLIFKKQEPKLCIRDRWDRSVTRLQNYPAVFTPS
tara:strand:+ start:5492 stop:5923 length:432 start_codon:yes stop_codon:yes gene_type:complete